MKKIYLLFSIAFIFSISKTIAQCNVVDTVNSFYGFLNPNGIGEYQGFLCSSTDSLGTQGTHGYYDGDGYYIRLLSGTQVTFFVDSCSGNPVSLTVVDSANTIIAGAFSASACQNSLNFTATYTGLYSVVMNLNGICGGGGTSVIGQVFVKITTGVTPPACPGISNDTICGAIELFVDGPFEVANTINAFPTDPMDPYLASIGADSCSPPNNTAWYFYRANMNIDTLNIWITSAVGSLFHSWLVGFVANDTGDFCNGGLTVLGCVPGAADEQGIDTVSITLFGVLSGQVYVFMIDGYNGGAGEFSIALKSDPYTLSIKEGDVSQFVVYPNPASETIHIRNENQNINVNRIILYDIFGRELSRTENYQDAADINVSQFPAGIYTLKIEGNNSNFSKKIIIE